MKSNQGRNLHWEDNQDEKQLWEGRKGMLHCALEWPGKQLISMSLFYAHSLPHPQQARARENSNATARFIASFALGNLSDLLIFLSMNRLTVLS